MKYCRKTKTFTMKLSLFIWLFFIPMCIGTIWCSSKFVQSFSRVDTKIMEYEISDAFQEIKQSKVMRPFWISGTNMKLNPFINKDGNVYATLSLRKSNKKE